METTGLPYQGPIEEQHATAWQGAPGGRQKPPAQPNAASRWFQRIVDGCAIAGTIMVAMGLYYTIIKAGIPYQDPTQELLIAYTVSLKVGEELLTGGFALLVLSTVARLGAIIVRTSRHRTASANIDGNVW